ncbi:MAG: 5-(carboxyamino)imidazole ribonucleotide synthase [Planctomycetes bacterium]|nr:5-(carboxyamino)imidazole ribonucleotide synthase [Planctomycetota bacterium]MCB9892311.1 5-(carboxyamino)imidazole ribonucleotide synthase [Planctomycetota bacterium]
MSEPILPGATLGVLGGGQLGRMFTMAARRMGYRVTVFAPEDDTPAGQIAYREVRAAYDDLDAVEAFSRSVDVVTFEFENVPSATAEAAGKHAPLRPSGTLLHTTQNRLREKAALTRLGLPVAPHAPVRTAAELEAISLPFPCILKSASWGYDGKGQRRVESRAELERAWDELRNTPCVLEQVIAFDREISVVGTRGEDSTIALYEPFQNAHENHILDVTLNPAPLPENVQRHAWEIARAVLEGLDVVGVLCVEMFVLADGTLYVNELAPRPHNSGHLTIDAHSTCQFEQQVRSVCALPLGSVVRKVPAAAMANLLGDLWESGEPRWERALGIDDAHLHLYGKEEARAGRKMGHLTVTAPSIEDAEAQVRLARRLLTPGTK